MQMFLELGSTGQARVWLDETATSHWHKEESLCESVSAASRGWFLLDEVSIEVLLSEGTGTTYGLLGCSFERSPVQDNSLALRIEPASPARAAPYPEALGDTAVQTVSCLPPELGPAILAGAQQALGERGSIPAGALVFATAACRPDDCDHRFFKRLGALCVQLLDLPIEADEDTCSALVNQALLGWKEEAPVLWKK